MKEEWEELDMGKANKINQNQGLDATESWIISCTPN